MRKGQKILTIALWGLTVIAMMSVIGAGLLRRQHQRTAQAGMELMVEPPSDPNRDPNKLDAYRPIPAFSLVDQNQNPVTNETLRNKICIVDFVFTRCAGPCPLMTQRMADLQKQIPGSDVQFISFTLDPTHDTPRVLKEYAAQHGADESRWRFLTGADEPATFKIANNMLLAAQPAHDQTPILHSTKFLLIDRQGQIRRFYDSNTPDELSQIPADVARLKTEQPAALSTPPAPPSRAGS
jgi:protein SCO1/2